MQDTLRMPQVSARVAQKEDKKRQAENKRQ
jgi:hypothetical protein